MKTRRQHYFAADGWDFKNNFLVGTEWTVDGSKAGSTYTVALTPKGFTCDCTGFTFHGKCKHSKQIVERFEHA